MWCVNYKDCKDIDEVTPSFSFRGDGKTIFRFFANGETEVRSGRDREQLLTSCSTFNGTNDGRGYCSALLQVDGWEIRDDYPW